MKLNEFDRGMAGAEDVGRYVALHGGSPMAINVTAERARADALRIMPADADLTTLTVEQIEA